MHPPPDSPSVFGAVLDRSAGHFRIAPYGQNVPAARRYLPGGLIVETTWQTETGWLIVRDALVLGPWHNVEQRSRYHRRTPTDWDAEHVLLRTVKCVNGTVDLEMSCEPAFDYHRGDAVWEYTGKVYEEATATCKSSGAGDHPTLRLTSNMKLGLEGREARARTRMVEDDNVFVALSWSHMPAPQTYDEAAEKMWQTAKFWREWITTGRFPDHKWRGYLQRSALALKGLGTPPPARCSPRRPHRFRKPPGANEIGTTATHGCAIRHSHCGGCTASDSTGRPTTSSRSSTTCPVPTTASTGRCR